MLAPMISTPRLARLRQGHKNSMHNKALGRKSAHFVSLVSTLQAEIHQAMNPPSMFPLKYVIMALHFLPFIVGN